MPMLRKVSSGKRPGELASVSDWELSYQVLERSGPRDSPEQCATLARVGTFATEIFGMRHRGGWKVFCRSLVALAGILVLTTTLANRTFEVRLNTRPSASSPGDRAKIQHRDKQGTRWSPKPATIHPFYLPVVEDAVEPEQEVVVSVHVDDCLYNRPPPRS